MSHGNPDQKESFSTVSSPPAASWWSRWAARWRRAPEVSESTEPDARFLRKYELFRRVLDLNSSTLANIASIDELLVGRSEAEPDALVRHLHEAVDDTRAMARALEALADRPQPALMQAVDAIAAGIENALPNPAWLTQGQLVLPISELRAADARLAGGKAAALGEAWWGVVGAEIPPSFVITTAAFARLLNGCGLVSRIAAIDVASATEDLVPLCHEAQSAILAAELPSDLLRDAAAALDRLCLPAGASLAVRSSALGEDGIQSHAGQYLTVLDVEPGLWADAYKRVVASAFSPEAVLYRARFGLAAQRTSMAVVVMQMIPARCSGVMFSRDPCDRQADRVVLSVAGGPTDGVTSGRAVAENLTLDPRGHLPETGLLTPGELSTLCKLVRELESYFGSPQDVEWAIDRGGDLFLLQTRPAAVFDRRVATIPTDAPVLVRGGNTACPGAASGPVFLVHRETDLGSAPQGAVVVAVHSSPELASLMTTCSAIVTEIGSPVGHMAILAREADVPCIVGLAGATSILDPGRTVTVDGSTCRILDGALAPARTPTVVASARAETATPGCLASVKELVVPLNLRDPRSADFGPHGCRSLHDVARLVHEWLYIEMFRVGALAQQGLSGSIELNLQLPFRIRVLNLGGALKHGASSPIALEHITSPPLLAVLRGLTDPRIRWSVPRPVSATGFLSVVGESLTGPPPDAQGMGRNCYALASNEYVSFSAKAGYHFANVDGHCCDRIDCNYVQLRFAGGGAGSERRGRRIVFLESVVGELGFRTQVRGDTIVARMVKVDAETILARLEDLARLMMVARQLDMLMDADSSAVFFAREFLDGRFDRF